MSEKVNWGTVGGLAVLGTGTAGIIYLGYKYFVEPGGLILAQYRYMLEDIYIETKKFLEDNAKLDPPIYGLTEGQKAIISAKDEATERIRPDVEEVLKSRGLDVNTWVTELIAGILIVYGISVIVPKLLEQLRLWKQQPAAANVQSSHGHAHILFEAIANEMSLSGKLNIASGFLSTIQSYYTGITEPAINAQIAYYNALIPTLPPGSLQYLVAMSMISYLSFEVSTAGIMGTLWTFWLIP